MNVFGIAPQNLPTDAPPLPVGAQGAGVNIHNVPLGPAPGSADSLLLQILDAQHNQPGNAALIAQLEDAYRAAAAAESAAATQKQIGEIGQPFRQPAAAAPSKIVDVAFVALVPLAALAAWALGRR